MELLDTSMIAQTLRVLWSAIVPTVAIPLVAFAVALFQGILGAREASVAYVMRVATGLAVIMLCGLSVSEAFRTLLIYSLR